MVTNMWTVKPESMDLFGFVYYFSFYLLISWTLLSSEYPLHSYFPLFWDPCFLLFSPNILSFMLLLLNVSNIFWNKAKIHNNKRKNKQKKHTKNKWVVNTVRELESSQGHNLNPLQRINCVPVPVILVYGSTMFSVSFSFWIPPLSRKLKGF